MGGPAEAKRKWERLDPEAAQAAWPKYLGRLPPMTRTVTKHFEGAYVLAFSKHDCVY